LPDHSSAKNPKNHSQKFPSTTVIGSYPAVVQESLIEQYKSAKEEIDDPVDSTIQFCVRDFLSAGIEVPSTGQTRDSFIRLFLDPEFVEGVRWDGAEIIVSEKIRRKRPIRRSDVKLARKLVPRYYSFKEPVTDPYTLARNCRIEGGAYSDLRELTFAIAKEIVRPELEDLQNMVDFLQLDAPYFSFEPFKDYMIDVYADLCSSLKVPVVLHVCGDSFGVFGQLTNLKGVGVISLDFTYSDRLLDEVAHRSFDQSIGLGCVSTGNPEVEPVRRISGLMEKAARRIGEDRIRFVHPACGERNLPLDVAYQKNVNLSLARNEVFMGSPIPARSVPLTESDYDPNGYFLVQVDNEQQQIIVSFLSYDHIPRLRLQSPSGEKLVAAIVDSKIISETDYGKRHLGYVGYEIGKAETALKNRVAYRQDRPLSLPHVS
jgi:methionine synthase II (cobalamin-independent)